MAISQSDLDSFHHFATTELTIGGRDLSFEELLERWHSHQEQLEAAASIRRGVADAQAGRLQPLNQVDDKIRGALGFPTRRQ